MIGDAPRHSSTAKFADRSYCYVCKWHFASVRGNAAIRTLSERSGHSASRAYRTGFMGTRPSTTLADLLMRLLVANPFSAVRASLRWWTRDEFEDGLTHGRQGRLRWRTVDSFFPVLLF